MLAFSGITLSCSSHDTAKSYSTQRDKLLKLLHSYEIPVVGFGIGTSGILNTDLLEQELELHLNKPGKVIGLTALQLLYCFHRKLSMYHFPRVMDSVHPC